MRIKKLLTVLLALVIATNLIAMPVAAAEALIPATVQSATTTDKNTITLTMNKALTGGSADSANGFSIGGTLTNWPIAVTSVAVSETDVTLTLDKDVIYGDTIVVSYGGDSATAKLTGADGDVESFSSQAVTNTIPIVLVTLLDITDAIAPINGDRPKIEIAETEQYTGEITWYGSPKSFEPNESYTATITLTAKNGYTFEGLPENAFQVPCAMSATNAANSGVITVTFISAPYGYITDGNGTMAYCFNEVYHNFDIMGFFHNGWKQTTCGNLGYGTIYKIGDSQPNDIYATGEPIAMEESGLTLDVDCKFAGEGKALQVVYTVYNAGTENVSFSFGSHADTQIGNTDCAPISIFDPNLASASLDRGFKMVSTSESDVNEKGDYAQFNFFGKRSVGVTDVDSFWYGFWNTRTSEVFTQVMDTSYVGDSGMTYSWWNRTIGAGETQTYKVIIGIGGADSADVLGYSVAYDDNVSDELISVPETQQKLENVSLTLSEQKPVRSGYKFDIWNTKADGSGTEYEPGDTYKLNESMTLFAQWKENPTNNLSITVSADPSGSVYVGETVTLTALVTEGGRAPAVANVYERYSTGLTYQWYSNTVNSVEGGAEISGAVSNAYQPPTATVGTTYYYCVVNSVNSNVVGVTVTSLPNITYTITATAGANGSISPSGAVNVSNGGDQQFTITPNAGYHIEDIKVDDLSVGAVSSYTFSNITANHTITASFAHNDDDDPIITYTITATAGANGSISPSGAVTVSNGRDQQFTIIPNAGYHIKDIKVDGLSVGAVSSYTFSKITANHTITASFAYNDDDDPIITYTITATAGVNGNISPSGRVTVKNSGDRQFIITPNAGYRIKDIKVDGLSVGSVSSYTFSNVTANHTITASFVYNDNGELDDIPKTGDIGSAFIWWALLTVSGAGILIFVLYRKKASVRR